jgi:hypothetical protein
MKRKQLQFLGYCMLIGLLAACTLMTTACSSKATTTQTTEPIISVAISPVSPADVKQGFTQNFYATALYASGATTDITSEVTWSSSNPSIAEFTQPSGGLLTGMTVGTVTITASFDGITSNSVSIKVVASNM